MNITAESVPALLAAFSLWHVESENFQNFSVSHCKIFPSLCSLVPSSLQLSYTLLLSSQHRHILPAHQLWHFLSTLFLFFMSEPQCLQCQSDCLHVSPWVPDLCNYTHSISVVLIVFILSLLIRLPWICKKGMDLYLQLHVRITKHKKHCLSQGIPNAAKIKFQHS